jgi:SAM-dependent methyltransferase
LLSAVSSPVAVARVRLRRARRRLRDAVVGSDPDVRTVREDLALRHLRGSGLEIGALDFPLRVPAGARVRYVDRKPNEGLREDFPELAGHDFVPVDVVDDATTLATIADETQDFVIASHVIEHLQDPIGALRAWVRVLRPGGVLWLAVPDRRQTFDHKRPPTPLDHVIRDHEEGPEASRRGHYEEWARLVNDLDEEHVAEYVDGLVAEGASIHFHVWELDGLVELLLHAVPGADLVHVQSNGHENLAVLVRR